MASVIRITRRDPREVERLLGEHPSVWNRLRLGGKRPAIPYFSNSDGRRTPSSFLPLFSIGRIACSSTFRAST